MTIAPGAKLDGRRPPGRRGPWTACVKDYFVEQADYQRWACAELFRALDTLGDDQRRADVGLFFKNIHKTVDHILVVTRNWKARLSGEFEKVTGYDVLLYPDWKELKDAVLEEFTRLGNWLSGKKPEWFGESIDYPGSDGKMRRVAVADGLIHIMTHAVHHRGQISAVCTRLGAPSPEMDFVFYAVQGRTSPLRGGKHRTAAGDTTARTQDDSRDGGGRAMQGAIAEQRSRMPYRDVPMPRAQDDVQDAQVSRAQGRAGATAQERPPGATRGRGKC